MAATTTRRRLWRLPAVCLLAVPVTKGWTYTLWLHGKFIAESATFTTADAMRRARRIDAPGVPILESGPGLQLRPFRWRT